MTSKQTNIYPSGIFIPVEKQAFFMLTFEAVLVSNHNIVPSFGPATCKGTCEVEFKYLGNKSYKPQSSLSDIEKAKEFIRENMSILQQRKSSKRKRRSNKTSFHTSSQIITLDDSEVRTVDLADIDHCEQEVIVLDDSILNSGRQTRQSSRNSSVVDLTDLRETKTQARIQDTDSDIKILSVKISPKKRSGNTNLITLTPKNRRKRKRKVKSCTRSLTRSMSNSKKSESVISLSPSDSLPRKKRKLQDISNIGSATSPPIAPQSDLSENALKYYNNISKVIGNAGRGEVKRSSRDKIPGRNHIANGIGSKSKGNAKRNFPLRVSLEGNKKRKVFSPEDSYKLKDVGGVERKHVQRLVSGSNLKSRFVWKSLRNGNRNSLKILGETNSFNPNPFEIDIEGLRPIVIDGCNVAIGHGKGKFSPKGLEICVDYFIARGHNKIKIFLPQFRQEDFSTELLETLNTKCDVVFTPSQCINGQRRTPYDDRFIVQYATEFGGVIVSTDNYRDISQENPRWQDTVAKRLLMFTWVDDFLMFPVDPLGRSGPTLEEFLRF